MKKDPGIHFRLVPRSPIPQLSVLLNKFAVPTPIPTGPNKNTRTSPVLGTPVVSVTWHVTDIPFLPEVKQGSSKKLVVWEKNVGDKRRLLRRCVVLSSRDHM